MVQRLKKLYDIPYVMTFLRDEREKMRTSSSPATDLFGALHQQALTGGEAHGTPLTPGAAPAATTPSFGGRDLGTPAGSTPGSTTPGTGPLVPAPGASAHHPAPH